MQSSEIEFVLMQSVLINVAKCKLMWEGNIENQGYELKCVAVPHPNYEQDVISIVEHCVKM